MRGAEAAAAAAEGAGASSPSTRARLAGGASAADSSAAHSSRLLMAAAAAKKVECKTRASCVDANLGQAALSEGVHEEKCVVEKTPDARRHASRADTEGRRRCRRCRRAAGAGGAGVGAFASAAMIRVKIASGTTLPSSPACHDCEH